MAQDPGLKCSHEHKGSTEDALCDTSWLNKWSLVSKGHLSSVYASIQKQFLKQLVTPLEMTGWFSSSIVQVYFKVVSLWKGFSYKKWEQNKTQNHLMGSRVKLACHVLVC